MRQDGWVVIISDAARDRTCTARAVVRSIHRTTVRAVKKIQIFFFVPFRPSFTHFLGTASPRRKQFLFLSKKTILTVFFSSQIVSRNVFTGCGEGQQNCDAPAKGLRYNSISHGHQRSFEKYSHGGESHAAGCVKNLPVVWIELLLETQTLSGSPGSCGEFETGAGVQCIPRTQ
jgi:hypothetical protein